MFKTELLHYQQEAVDKLGRIKIGALYMEQGTGKTRTTLELAVRRFQKGKIDKVLWLCPNSVKKSLAMDIEKHLEGDTSFIEIYGIHTLSASSRVFLELLQFVTEHRVFIIIDESNLVKNWTAKRTARIIDLAGHCHYRMILNGTPVSRNEADLFAQWFILDWRVLGYKSYYSFARNHLEYDKYGNIEEVLNVKSLTDKIAPFTYQIKKSECMTLPDKEFNDCYFELTEAQRVHMRRVGTSLLYFVDEYDSTTIYRLLSCLHLVVNGYFLQLKESKVFDECGEMVYRVSTRNKRRFFENIHENPRLNKLLDVLKENTEHDEKVIIFAEYNDDINEIMQLLSEVYGPEAAVQFNGEIPQKKRDKHLQKFAEDARFLVANKQCAGYGLNLQHAHVVIFYSVDWDWAMREQAEDRVHRLGQECNVRIYDILANHTIDERIKGNLARKTDLVESLKAHIDEVKKEIREVGKEHEDEKVYESKRV